MYARLFLLRSQHENPPYLPGIKLSELVVATTVVTEATEGAGIVFVVVPTPFVRGDPRVETHNTEHKHTLT